MCIKLLLLIIITIIIVMITIISLLSLLANPGFTFKGGAKGYVDPYVLMCFFINCVVVFFMLNVMVL